MGLVSDLLGVVNNGGFVNLDLTDEIVDLDDPSITLTGTNEAGETADIKKIHLKDFDAFENGVDVHLDLDTFASDLTIQLTDDREFDNLVLEGAELVSGDGSAGSVYSFLGIDGLEHTLTLENVTATVSVEIPGVQLGPGAGRDLLEGGGGGDTIDGGAGHDTIEAGAGNDMIVAGVDKTSLGGSGERSYDFPLISLGNHADVDTHEHNGRSENAEDLLGTYGDEDAPLNTQIVFAVANDLDQNDRVDDNDEGRTAETYTINGQEYALDSTQTYNATVTFADGRTGQFTAVVIQFQNGDVYMAPEPFDNEDSELLESGEIISISLDSVERDNTNLYGLRLDADYQVGDDDEVDAGSGDDTILGGIGKDTILGGIGGDQVFGGAGADVLDGGSGDDVIEGGSGDDTLETGSGQDTLYGGLGDDYLHNASGDDLLFGGAGNDSIIADHGADSLFGGLDNDTLRSGSGDDLLSGDSGDDNLFGDLGDDSLFGGDGNDILDGGAGDDTLVGGAGADYFEGGTAMDYADYSANHTAVNINLSNGAVSGGDADGDTLSGIDGIIGTDFNDSITGFDGQGFNPGDVFTNVFYGGAGDDTLSGLGGDDSLFGGVGRDLIYGGTGGDSLSGGSGDDIIFGGSGDDSLTTGSGNDQLFGGAGADTLHNSSGDDSLVGGSGDDLIIADFGNDTLEGGLGNDTLVGGVGADSLSGGAGADSMTADSGDDFLDGGAGGDTIDGGVGADTVSGGSGDDSIIGGAGGDVLAGGAGSDTIFGGSGDDSLTTGSGNDQLFGGAGDDTLRNSSGDDSLVGGSGDDLIIANIGNDTLEGGIGDDTLEGGSGDDSLYGGAGQDVIYSGSGDDQAFGGGDRDVFVVEDGFGADTIAGGEGGDDFDTLDFSSLSGPVTVTYDGDESGSATDGTDTLFFSEIEHVILTSGDDALFAGADTQGINVEALSGDDTIYGGQGGDSVVGGQGADEIYGDRGADTIFGGSGDDDLGGDSGDDQVYGGLGSDYVEGGHGVDTLEGASGDDTIDGGAGDDLLTGGEGFDTFVISSGDDIITDFGFASGGVLDDGDQTNNDFIDLSSYYDNYYELHADFADDGILNQSNATDTKGRSVDYDDNTAMSGGTTFQGASQSDFTADSTNVVCFAAGTMIRTPDGERAVEDLRPGDLVETLDQGARPLRWVGAQTIARAKLEREPRLRPIRIAAGALGPGAPARDLFVSPHHRILASGPVARTMFDEDQVLVPAKALVGVDGVTVAEADEDVLYVHVCFEGHEIIFADGAPAEAFFPGPQALKSLKPADRESFLDTDFPRPPDQWDPVRPLVSVRRGGAFARRSAKNRKPILATA